MTNNNFKSPYNTIKLLLRTNAVPYLIVDYTKDSLTTLMNRFNMFLLCTSDYMYGNISLKILPVQEKELEDLILASTRLTVDYNVITDEMFNDLLESISHAGEIMRSRLIEIDNKKGTGFQSSDFETLCRLATKAKLDKDFWSLED